MSAGREALIHEIFDVRHEGAIEWDALCPVHDDSDPSARVNPEKMVWFCHSCHTGGKVSKLAVDLGFELPEDMADWEADASLDSTLRLLEDLEDERTYPEAWLARYGHTTSYWTNERGFAQATVDHWLLGFEPASQRGTIPLRNFQGELLGVSRRATRHSQEVKYIDPEGLAKNRHLFGAHEAQNASGGILALVEGPLDVIAFWEVGITAVAPLGSWLTQEQVDLIYALWPDEICLAYDNDLAGRQGTAVAYELLRGSGLMLTLAKMPPGRDPASLPRRRRRRPIELADDLWWQPYRDLVPERFKRAWRPHSARRASAQGAPRSSAGSSTRR